MKKYLEACRSRAKVPTTAMASRLHQYNYLRLKRRKIPVSQYEIFNFPVPLHILKSVSSTVYHNSSSAGGHSLSSNLSTVVRGGAGK